MENGMEFSQKIKENYLMIQQFHFGVYTPLKVKGGTWTDMCKLIFRAALFTIAKVGSNPGVHGMNG